MKTLTLVIENEKKDFTVPFVSGWVWRKWIELNDNVVDPKKLTIKELDEFVNLTVLAFENQFTLEQFYKGIPFNEVMRTVESLFIPEVKNEGNEKN